MEEKDEFNKQFLKNAHYVKLIFEGQSCFNAYSVLTSLSAEIAIMANIDIKTFLEDCGKCYLLLDEKSDD